MKRTLKNLILYYINNPAKDILSSQTLYESLLFCLDMFEITKEEMWKQESKLIADMICSSQNPDGGFNIGYDFIFGKNINKKELKESTTPEILSLYALARYRRQTGDSSVNITIDKAVSWVKENTLNINENEIAIPYAPLTLKDVHITNGVSFTIGAISETLEEYPELKNIHSGMIKFMYNELEDARGGSFWRYFYRRSPHYLENPNKDKVDNYHIAQQLKYHCVSYKNSPSDLNLEIIKRVTEYLLQTIDTNGWAPYVENGMNKTDKIDLWGYASLLKALSESYQILNDKRILDKVVLILNNIVDYAWNGEYFYPIILQDGKVFDGRFYPRSDAWVIHSIAHYMVAFGKNEELVEMCCKNYRLIKTNNFRGDENHAITFRKKVFSKIISLVKK